MPTAIVDAATYSNNMIRIVAPNSVGSAEEVLFSTFIVSLVSFGSCDLCIKNIKMGIIAISKFAINKHKYFSSYKVIIYLLFDVIFGSLTLLISLSELLYVTILD